LGAAGCCVAASDNLSRGVLGGWGCDGENRGDDEGGDAEELHFGGCLGLEVVVVMKILVNLVEDGSWNVLMMILMIKMM